MPPKSLFPPIKKTPPSTTTPFGPACGSSTNVHPIPDLSTAVAALQLCSLHRHLPKAQQIHSFLLVSGLHSSPFAATALINLYSKCSLPLSSLAILRSTPHPTLPVFNAAISALSSSLPVAALRLFCQMRLHSSPDHFTFPCVIKSCSNPPELGAVHAALFRFGLHDDQFTASALIHVYLKFGLSDDARKVFDELPDRDVVLWNSMVNGFAQMGQFGLAIDYFHRMTIEGLAPSRFTVTGILSVFTATADLNNGKTIQAFAVKAGYDSHVETANALIDLYGKCHVLEDAVRVFKEMPDRDLFSWNSIISVFQHNADHGGTLQLFAQMQLTGVRPDAVTVAGVLPACAHVAALSHGREVHSFVVRSGIGVGGRAGNALVDMYAKCGALDCARRVFDGMPTRDVASWNIMIDGYAAHGQGREALTLFEDMGRAGVAADVVTLVALLSACSHTGLVEAGREILQRIVDGEYCGVRPVMEHYSCVVDMLGRARRLREAREVAEESGEAAVWKVYLAACQMHGKTEAAAEAAEHVVGSEPEGSGGYVLLSNAYGSAGRYGEVAEVRREMRRRGMKKVVGCSWVEVGATGLHSFVTDDKNHPEAEGIYVVLHGLAGRMRECGYMPDATNGGRFGLGSDLHFRPREGIGGERELQP